MYTYLTRLNIFIDIYLKKKNNTNYYYNKFSIIIL